MAATEEGARQVGCHGGWPRGDGDSGWLLGGWATCQAITGRHTHTTLCCRLSFFTLTDQ